MDDVCLLAQSYCKPCRRAYRKESHERKRAQPPPEPTSEKVCPRCVSNKPTEDFNRNARAFDGLQVRWPTPDDLYGALERRLQSLLAHYSDCIRISETYSLWRSLPCSSRSRDASSCRDSLPLLQLHVEIPVVLLSRC